MLVLTALGRESLERVGTALGLLSAVPHPRGGCARQRLRVTSPPTLARQILVPDLEQVTSSRPQMELEVVLSIPYLTAGASQTDVEIRIGDARQHPPPEPWRPWFAAAGLDWPQPTSGPKRVDLGLTLEAAVCGQGAALARPSLAVPWLASGALRPLPFGVTPAQAQQWHLLPHAQSGAAQEFAHWPGAPCERVRAQAQAWVCGSA
jgi:DNA-binding transcriptional LysR family regulator